MTTPTTVELQLGNDDAHVLLNLLAEQSQTLTVWVQKDPWDDGPQDLDEVEEANEAVEFLDRVALDLADRLSAIGEL